MSSILTITDSELWVVEATLRERYGKPVEVQLADVELRLDPAVMELTQCPAMVWKEQGAGFIISKVADDRFRCQFFYSAREQYGTGKAEYDDLLDCVVTLLKLQADHEVKRQQQNQ